jgi:hypothetical protein
MSDKSAPIHLTFAELSALHDLWSAGVYDLLDLTSTKGNSIVGAHALSTSTWRKNYKMSQATFDKAKAAIAKLRDTLAPRLSLRPRPRVDDARKRRSASAKARDELYNNARKKPTIPTPAAEGPPITGFKAILGEKDAGKHLLGPAAALRDAKGSWKRLDFLITSDTTSTLAQTALQYVADNAEALKPLAPLFTKVTKAFEGKMYEGLVWTFEPEEGGKSTYEIIYTDRDHEFYTFAEFVKHSSISAEDAADHIEHWKAIMTPPNRPPSHLETETAQLVARPHAADPNRPPERHPIQFLSHANGFASNVKIETRARRPDRDLASAPSGTYDTFAHTEGSHAHIHRRDGRWLATTQISTVERLWCLATPEIEWPE